MENSPTFQRLHSPINSTPRTHNCIYAKANYDNNIIQQIKDISWIVIMKQDEVIKTICNQDVQYQRSKGVFLLTTDSS